MDAADLRTRVVACDQATQRSIVRTLLAVVRPFGRLAPAVIEPAAFDQLADQVDAAFDSADPAMSDLAAAIEGLPPFQVEEEPDGVEFYAFGALVDVLYAARVLAGEPDAVRWALSRAEDLLDLADDQLGTSCHRDLLRWVDATIDAPELPDRQDLLAATSAAAASLGSDARVEAMLGAARSADTVVVVAGASFDPKHRRANQVLATFDDRAVIEALVAALDGEESDRAFMTPGGPTLVFLLGRTPVASVTLLADEFVRCHEFLTGDLELAEPGAIGRIIGDASDRKH